MCYVYSFMWQMCGYIPQTLLSQQPEVTEMAAQLSASFFLETFIHAKEKVCSRQILCSLSLRDIFLQPTMVQWVELLTKQFNSSVAAGEWFLSHMASNEWWPMQILIKCPNQMVRQMFHRLCIHVIQRLRTTHTPLYNKPDDTEITGPADGRNIGNHSCVTRFIRMLLTLVSHCESSL
jgi:ubiquitin carboxyl-terminal hydrolase 34